MGKYQFTLKSLLFATFIVACLTSATIVAVNKTSQNIEATRSAYAAQLVAYMCVEHLKANQQHWPRNWDDLADDFNAGYAQSGQKWTWTFADLKQRVDVNWNTDPRMLRSDQINDPVVWISDFPDREHYMTSPNEIVIKYLQSAKRSSSVGR